MTRMLSALSICLILLAIVFGGSSQSALFGIESQAGASSGTASATN